MASLTLDWIHLAEIVGALQGFLLAGMLVAQFSNRTANRLLATLMLAMSIYLASGPYYAAGVIRAFPHFFAISYLMPWVFGQLVFLYARAASDRDWQFSRWELGHFLPVAIVVILAMPLYVMSGAEKVATWERWSAQGLGPPLRSIDPLKYVLGIGYTAATLLFLRRHRRDIEHSYSNLERVNLRWVFRLSAACGAIWLLATGLRVSQVSTNLRDGHIALAMALLVYGIGYMGLRQPEIFRHMADDKPLQRDPSVPSAIPSPGEDTTPSQYEHSGLDDAEAVRLKAALLAVMERDALWKDSELTLPDLAARVQSTPHKVSEVLNAQLGQTFYDFVNAYRVRDVQRRISAGEALSRKMLALAMDAGFASKSTFNEAFKKHTNLTPSAFRQTVGS
jgi:AraC-like DNA-binding protein